MDETAKKPNLVSWAFCLYLVSGSAVFQPALSESNAPCNRRGRPAGSGTKVSTTIRFDADVLDAFRATGEGWQTRMNDVLKDWLKSNRGI
jgi:uncharacterized protein (DUF4415 family)